MLKISKVKLKLGYVKNGLGNVTVSYCAHTKLKSRENQFNVDAAGVVGIRDVSAKLDCELKLTLTLRLGSKLKLKLS